MGSYQKKKDEIVTEFGMLLVIYHDPKLFLAFHHKIL